MASSGSARDVKRLAAQFIAIVAMLQPLAAQTSDKSPQGGWAASVSAPKPATGSQALDATPQQALDRSVAVASPAITAAALEGDNNRTRIVFGATKSTDFTVFRLSNPYRVVVDLDNVNFRLPAGTGRQGRGLITAYRYGLFAPGKARIVIDTAGPARIESAKFAPAGNGNSARLEIELAPSTATELAAAELASAAQSIELPNDNAAPGAQPEPQASTAPERARPVIVIDPGHGGIDPGALGSHGVEKDVVLAVALQVRKSLLATRRFEVVMTRSSDVFVSLDNRVRISQRSQADLFISIHADSLEQKEIAKSVRGATIYSLSERASDERSRALAEKENAADLFAGVSAAVEGADGEVRHILFDLIRRESHTFSNEFRGQLARQLRPKLRLAKDPIKSAPFRVLRQPGSPAVLLELGYMTNSEDEQLMASAEWQQGVAEALTKAVGDFFQKHHKKPAQ